MAAPAIQVHTTPTEAPQPKVGAGAESAEVANGEGKTPAMIMNELYRDECNRIAFKTELAPGGVPVHSAQVTIKGQDFVVTASNKRAAKHLLAEKVLSSGIPPTTPTGGGRIGRYRGRGFMMGGVQPPQAMKAAQAYTGGIGQWAPPPSAAGADATPDGPGTSSTQPVKDDTFAKDDFSCGSQSFLFGGNDQQLGGGFVTSFGGGDGTLNQSLGVYGPSSTGHTSGPGYRRGRGGRLRMRGGGFLPRKFAAMPPAQARFRPYARNDSGARPKPAPQRTDEEVFGAFMEELLVERCGTRFEASTDRFHFEGYYNRTPPQWLPGLRYFREAGVEKSPIKCELSIPKLEYDDVAVGATKVEAHGAVVKKALSKLFKFNATTEALKAELVDAEQCTLINGENMFRLLAAKCALNGYIRPRFKKPAQVMRDGKIKSELILATMVDGIEEESRTVSAEPTYSKFLNESRLMAEVLKKVFHVDFDEANVKRVSRFRGAPKKAPPAEGEEAAAAADAAETTSSTTAAAEQNQDDDAATAMA